MVVVALDVSVVADVVRVFVRVSDVDVLLEGVLVLVPDDVALCAVSGSHPLGEEVQEAVLGRSAAVVGSTTSSPAVVKEAVDVEPTLRVPVVVLTTMVLVVLLHAATVLTVLVVLVSVAVRLLVSVPVLDLETVLVEVAVETVEEKDVEELDDTVEEIDDEEE